MSQNSKIREFPDISNKLTAPTKKSLFERQKAEAEAKRQREQQETAAVLEDFVKSFDDEDEGSPPIGGGVRGFGDRGASGPPRRHFSGALAGPPGRGGSSSGPGSLGPPPPSLSRKRAYDGSPPTQREGLFAFEDAREGPADPKTALQNSDDEDADSRSRAQERAIPKPTLRLSSLPPGTSPAAIKSFIPSTLTVNGVRILPPAAPGTMERRSLSALVTLAKDTPALDIDNAVSALQNRYMGYGFYLSLSRHLSSAAVGLDTPALGFPSASSSLPFGARPIPPPNMGRAPPGSHRGGFAPPSSYNPAPLRGAPQVQVNVTPPSDIKQLRLIHKTLEALLSHGPEFEALLMTRKNVQTEEKWAWLWDSRSAGGVYYRWRLWDLLTGTSRRKSRNFSSTQLVFEGGAAWALPEGGLPFEYTTRLEEFVSDSDYDSSEDEDSGDEGRRRYAHHHGGAAPPDAASLEADTDAYLNPLQKAKLTHLLARLPTTNAKLRRGDVARVTAFAIQHAGVGAAEVVQMITSNITRPLAFTSANPDRKQPPPPTTEDKDKDTFADAGQEKDSDPSSAKLIALYLISDILSSSSTSGVRHAWRYRQLFETALTTHHTFEHLGRLDKRLNWGRLRAEKWKRSVQNLLTLWEGWCVFPQSSQEAFANSFSNPPLTKEEEAAAAAAESERAEKEKARSRWKTVDEKAAEERRRRIAAAEHTDHSHPRAPNDAMDIDNDDIDGEAMASNEADSDLDGSPMPDEDFDGAAMPDFPPASPPNPSSQDAHSAPPPPPPSAPPSTQSTDRRTLLAASIAAKLGKTAPPAQQQTGKAASPAGGRRERPRAADMFAVDSDGE
ncbi:U2 snRNP-associated SURP domain-containing protein [Puttea exsequens]|nr:U2 snRNP-associated SURP domain-containing protein [Puttea exsequens]